MNEWMSKQRIHDGIHLEIRKTSPEKKCNVSFIIIGQALLYSSSIYLSLLLHDILGRAVLFLFSTPNIPYPYHFNLSQIKSILTYTLLGILKRTKSKVNQEGEQLFSNE